MAEKRKLIVDLADPKDAEKKLATAEDILREKLEAVSDAEAEVRDWAEKVKGLRILSGKVLEFDGSDAAPMQALVVSIIERERREMRPVEVAQILRIEGHQVASNDAVNAALHAAAQAGRLRRPKQRHYAPKK
jgi:glutamyl-tRNA reductase